MQTHDLKRKHKNQKNPKVGRGGTRGKTSGRGHKGQKARAGRKLRPEIRDIIKKIPKKRGYKFNTIQPDTQAVSLTSLNEKFSEGERVNPKILARKGLVQKKGRRNPLVKILGVGELQKKLVFEKVTFSESAEKKILKAGGEISRGIKGEAKKEEMKKQNA